LKIKEFVIYFALQTLKNKEEMEGNLVIVESPAKAKTIQKFLGSDFVVKPSFGHIRDLQEKQLSIDVDNGFAPEYVVPADKKRVVDELSRLAAKSSTVWLASDEDREGEAISWHLVETLGLKKENTKRIAFHEITKDAIQNAIKNPRGLDMNLVNAQQARRVLDRLVGFELSPILWKKINRGLSAGRVQSVALRLVVDKEREILAFTPEAYYRVEGKFKHLPSSSTIKGLLNARFNTEEEAEKFLSDSIGANYVVDSVEKVEGTRFPAAPFTTSTLQQEASRKLRFPVSQTMRVAQSLYEKGLITYMRTDSTNLSNLALGTSKKFIIDTFGQEYSHPRQYKTHSKGAQEAHEAIRPTYIENTTINGTSQEKALYELIWKRTVASQMAEAKVLNTTIGIASDKRAERFNAEATEVLFDGFLKLYIEGNDDDSASDDIAVLPNISKGDSCNANEIAAECKYTRAPMRYTEASLVKKLEELGIGRPSTYAPTISTLTTARGYIVRGNKEGIAIEVKNLKLKGSSITSSIKKEKVGEDRGKLLPQDVGIMVSDYLTENFPDIMSYNYTADVEKHLDEIADGNEDWKKYLGEIYPAFHKTVDEKMHDGQYNHVEKILGTDPADGLQVIAKFGQYGPFVQKGEGENRRFASMEKGQLIESITLEQAIKLLSLPRIVGRYEDVDIVANKGRFGPYIKYGTVNISLPKGADPLNVGMEECIKLIDEQKNGASGGAIKEFPSGISILNGRYGAYIKYNGANYHIPKGKKAENLSEDECRTIIEKGPAPAKKSYRKFKKSK